MVVWGCDSAMWPSSWRNGMMEASSTSMSKQDSKVFIGGLSWETTDEKLRRYFENYGAVHEAFVSYDRNTGRPRGFGFVVFDDPGVADKVVSLQHTIDRREVKTLTSARAGCLQNDMPGCEAETFSSYCRSRPRRPSPRWSRPGSSPSTAPAFLAQRRSL